MKNTILLTILFCVFFISMSANAAEHNKYKYVVYNAVGDTLLGSNSVNFGGDNIAHKAVGTTINWKWNATGCDSTDGTPMHSDKVGATLKLAFDQWKNVTTSSADFDDGTTTAIDYYSPDDTNVLFWATSEAMCGACGFTENIRAVTATTTHYMDRTITVESDIIFNGRDYNWTDDYTEASDTGTKVAGIQAIATHEIGHLLGFFHNDASASVMNNDPGYEFDDDWHTLAAEDSFAVSYVYGGNIIDSYSLTNGTFYFDWDTTIASGKILTIYGVASNAELKVATSKIIYVDGTLSLNNSIASNYSTLTKSDASNWGGVVINSGGKLSLNNPNIIEYATTGVTINANSSTPIDNGSDSLSVKYCTTSMNIYNSTATIQNISFSNITNDAIEIDHSSSDPTIDKVTIYDGEYGIDVHSAADATLTDSVIEEVDEDNIYFENAAGIDMNGGDNDIDMA